ncbi:RNA-binding protein [Candidatus Bathyarchaeota archaeon]|nr:RNA-binding protein [Candidatus Bathyarchaeota archaeon]
MDKKRMCIAIPASVVSDTPHLREKTSKIGLIGRAAAIFRVNEIIVYPDNPKVNQRAEMDLIALLLSYMETPQYLRKRLFKLRPQLRYAGILPPLRTPHHPLNRRIKDLKIDEYREGVTLSETGEGTLIDIGVEKPALFINKKLHRNRRVTVRITKIEKQIEVELANRDEIPSYWGYKIAVEHNSLGKAVRSEDFDLIVATSKYGAPFTHVAAKMTEKWEKANRILVVFGAPTQGLYEIAKQEGLSLDDITDFVVNMVPSQGTETIRTEEALFASLAILNAHFGF